MDATIVPKMQKHYPVLLKEIISVISPQHGGTFIDCTFGQGGYSKKILDFKNTKVIAIDRDIESEKIADQLKENFKDRFIFASWAIANKCNTALVDPPRAITTAIAFSKACLVIISRGFKSKEIKFMIDSPASEESFSLLEETAS